MTMRTPEEHAQDDEWAKRVKDAVETLNAAIQGASSIGLTVEISTVTCRYITDLVERPRVIAVVSRPL